MGIKKKLLLYFIITTIIIGTAGIVSYYSVARLVLEIKTLINTNIAVTDLVENVNNVENLATKLLRSHNTEILKEYKGELDNLKDKLDSFDNSHFDKEEALMIKNIKRMTEEYINQGNLIIIEEDLALSTQYYTSLLELGRLIRFSADHQLTGSMKKNSDKYLLTFNSIEKTLFINIIVLELAIAINVVLIILFSSKLTYPLIQLAKSAKDVSEGNFQIEPIVVDTKDEIEVTAKAFNTMVVNIKKYIDDLQNKANLETALKEKENQNLKIKNMLKNAEIRALQAQINPHFLYNTLNTGVQLAIVEEADETGRFLVNVSDIFRYNLNNINRIVTLDEEITYIKKYIFILKTRFGNKYTFEINIEDEKLKSTPVLCMILQPIVENAFNHGFSDVQEKREIKIKVEDIGEYVHIAISDNGKGMSKELVDKLNNDDSESEIDENSTSTGIGIKNIRNRLNIFYNRKDLLFIESTENKGTTINIYIPKTN